VADPFRPDLDLIVLSVVDRGVATSSTVKRRWQVGDVVLHHLIDPRTGRPSTSDAVQVTVVTSSAALADYHAKVALLMGADEALAYLNKEPDVEGLVVRRDASLFATAGLNDYR
jgi:thiamine biosynthesis lipoprotein